MQEIRRVLKAAAGRLMVVRLIDRVVWSVSAVVVLLILAVVADRALVLGWSWERLGMWGLAAGVVVGLVWTVLSRPDELTVARVVDERADLREALSTSLCVEKQDDAWSKAVVASAAEKAKSVVVKDAIPIEGPSHWKLPTALMVVLMVTVFLMPTLDLRGVRKRAQAQAEKQQEIAQALEQQNEADRMIREIMQKHDLNLKDEQIDPNLDDDLKKPESPEAIRKQAIKKLTNLTEALARKQESEQAKSLEALKDMMRQLRSPGEGELNEFSRQLSRGNFTKAQQELNNLARKLSEGKLNAAQQAVLKKQMATMARQLEKMAQNKSDVEQALKQAGMSAQQARKLAASPEALKKALEAMQNMSPEQKQKLIKMAKAMSQAGQQCQTMAQAMSQMAKGMGQQGMSQEGMKAMDAMSGQLSQMEMLSQDLQGANQAMAQALNQMKKLGQCNGSQSWCNSQCQGGPGNKPWQPGNSLSQGNGSGGKGGKGHGDGPESEEADFMFRHEKANVLTKGGPIIGSRYVYGEQIKGEAREAFAAAVEAASEQAAEDITTMNVDPQYRQAVKHYFGRLDERVKAQKAQGTRDETETSKQGSDHPSSSSDSKNDG